MDIKNYNDEWNDGQDFRPSKSYFCEKCNHKGTFITRVRDEETGLINTIAQDCVCKIEHLARIRLKLAGIHPEFRNLDCKKELNSKIIEFADQFYDNFKNPDKLSQNILITGENMTRKTRFLANFAKYLLLKSVNINLKYITMHDLLLTINKIWKSGDYAEIEIFHTYDFLIVDKVELGINYLKQNMNMVTFNSIFDKRDHDQKPTIISCGTLDDIDYLNLNIERFIHKDMKD